MRFLDQKQLEQKIPFKETAIRRMIREEGFPAPLRTARKNVWRESDIDAWFEAKFQASGRKGA
jgi:predicted DNA-binding transcriptional regulator AlpA